MTKGEIRKARKEAVAAGQSWNIEAAEGGGMAIVRERTPAEERRHRDGWDRWASRMADRD